MSTNSCKIGRNWAKIMANFPLKCLTNPHEYAPMWSKVGLSEVIWGAQSHVYQYVDKSTVITLLSIVNLSGYLL